MIDFEKLKDFYTGKRIFLTGHTGFKGSWMCEVLLELGARVTGYGLEPNTDPAIFDLLGLSDRIRSVIGDVRDMAAFVKAYTEAKPDVVFHLAAQPIVRESYKEPRYTYETNVMGTVNLLECVRKNPGAISVLNVTTDKVYENSDQPDHPFCEDEKLDGFDPYSNSKSCSELVTHSYRKSFDLPPVSTARAGNVIGGGDFAKDRIIPDCVRATVTGESIIVRNPYSTRPYQHVLEPVFAYLLIAMRQAKETSLSDAYNVGPDDCDCLNTGEIADLFVENWGAPANWKNVSEANAPHEAAFLKLNCNKVRQLLGWAPKWHTDAAVGRTVEWYKAWNEGADMSRFTQGQIEEYLKS